MLIGLYAPFTWRITVVVVLLEYNDHPFARDLSYSAAVKFLLYCEIDWIVLTLELTRSTSFTILYLVNCMYMPNIQDHIVIEQKIELRWVL